MEMNSYINLYSEEVANNVAYMIAYIKACDIDIQLFYDTFICSSLAKDIENKNIKSIIGLSGTDYAYIIINSLQLKKHHKLYKKLAIKIIDHNNYYQFSYFLTMYQQSKNISFIELNSLISLNEGIKLMETIKNQDEFFNYMDDLINDNKKETNLKKLRIVNGLSQSELSHKSNVTLRSIQMYEQRHNDINKAQYSNLTKLADSLNTTIEEICE